MIPIPDDQQQPLSEPIDPASYVAAESVGRLGPRYSTAASTPGIGRTAVVIAQVSERSRNDGPERGA